MSVLTIQPENTSCHLYEAAPTTNFSEQYLIQNSKTNYNSRPLLRFDFSALPAGVTIISAILSLYYYDKNADPSGRTLEARRITQRDWVATESTWIKCQGTDAWATPGGQFSALNIAYATVPADVGAWINWDIINIINLLIADPDTYHNIADVIIKDQNEDSGATDLGCSFRSNWYGADTSLRPKLVITYTTPYQTRPTSLGSPFIV
jgi:hypothetical protein